MFLGRASRVIRQQCRFNGKVNKIVSSSIRNTRVPASFFHSTRNLQVVKPVLLADIGEGKQSNEAPIPTPRPRPDLSVRVSRLTTPYNAS